MADSLLSIAILGVIVTIVLPTTIAVHSLNQESYEKLELYRTFYIDVNSSKNLKMTFSYSVEEGRVCHKEKSYCLDIDKQ